MKPRKFQIQIFLLMFLAAATVSAPNAGGPDSYHPFLTSKFRLGIGVFTPLKRFNIQVDGSDPGNEIDFNEALDHKESESTPALSFSWRYSKNWLLAGEYWSVGSRNSAVLPEDIEWEDYKLLAGSFVESEVDTSIVRVFFGRSFLQDSPEQEFGLGAGLHWLEINAFIEGDFDDGTSIEFKRENVSAEFPLPNIGAWYMYSWSPKWMASASLDWLSVSIGAYSGGLLNGQIGVNYQISEIFGLGLSYSIFDTDIDVDKTDWHGAIETSQQGPLLLLTATW